MGETKHYILDSSKSSISLNNLLSISYCTEFQIVRELKYLQEEMKKTREQRKYSLYYLIYSFIYLFTYMQIIN